MADTKITALTALTGADPANDVIPIVDVSDTTMAASGTTKKISVNNILGASGTATLASATITGALAANADTTLGTASKATNTNLNFSSDLGTQRIYLDRGTRSLVFQDVTSSIENYRIAGITGVHTWGVGGSTAMTLNATGLGVGTSPGVAFDLQGTSPMARITATSTTGYSSLTLRNTGASGRQYGITVGGSGTGAVAGNLVITDDTASATRLVLDATGNLGIGVTPSAWGGTYKALQINTYGSVSATSTATNVASNWFWTGSANNYIATGFATLYQQISGTHAWYTAPSGTGGTGISFTQAMTLDASGNLLVGTTSTSGSSSNATTVVLGGSRSANGSVSATTAVASTIFSITGALRGRYEVIALIANSGNAALYTSIATILWDGNSGRVVANNGTNLTITLSGSDVQITQVSGSTQTVFWSFLRVAL